MATLRELQPERRFVVEEDGQTIGYIVVGADYVGWGEERGNWHTLRLQEFKDLATRHGRPLRQAQSPD